MNKIQINKSRMYFATDLVLDNHLETISPFPELSNAHQRLKESLDMIEQYRQVQEVDSSGLTINKTKLRVDLSQLIHQFSSALMAYGTITKDADLKTKASYNHTKLMRSPDPILYDIGLLLFNLATPIKTELERFFITQAEFDAIALLLNRFKEAIPQKRIATSTSKVSTANIRETFAEIDRLLKEELDVLMLIFQFTQADFYNEYKSARIIVDYSGGASKTSEEVMLEGE